MSIRNLVFAYTLQIYHLTIRTLVRMVLCCTFISRWFLAVMAIVAHPSFSVPLNGSFFPSVSGGAV